MRLCRFEHDGTTQAGFYLDDVVIPLTAAAEYTGNPAPEGCCLISKLPGGADREAVVAIQSALANHLDEELAETINEEEDIQPLRE